MSTSDQPYGTYHVGTLRKLGIRFDLVRRTSRAMLYSAVDFGRFAGIAVSAIFNPDLPAFDRPYPHPYPATEEEALDLLESASDNIVDAAQILFATLPAAPVYLKAAKRDDDVVLVPAGMWDDLVRSAAVYVQVEQQEIPR
jgi:hypothetical protein